MGILRGGCILVGDLAPFCSPAQLAWVTEWLTWKIFDEATSKETGEEDCIVVLGRGQLGPGR
jgi:hypothetical protein